MNGVKRGLFSNEAGSGSAPCAAAAADCERPAQMGLVQALGVFIDTIVICSCTAMLMLLAPQNLTNGLTGMNLLQTAMNYHLGGSSGCSASRHSLESYSMQDPTSPTCSVTNGDGRQPIKY